jgi:hypothetical protein
MSNYNIVTGFEDIYLEDSWVLGIRLEPGLALFEVELVILESHPRYTTPRPGEQYCYLRGQIRFEGVSSVRWTGQGVVKPAVDATGEVDYGAIDAFDAFDTHCELEGDFGRLEIESPWPSLNIL